MRNTDSGVPLQKDSDLTGADADIVGLEVRLVGAVTPAGQAYAARRSGEPIASDLLIVLRDVEGASTARLGVLGVPVNRFE